MPPSRRSERGRAAATRPPGGARAAKPGPPAPARPARVPGIVWLLALPLALGALVFACRGAALGTAVADDYSFLHRLAFQRPLDAFDSMGATYYWRPVSRQLYFSLVGRWLLTAPWVAALLHALILCGSGGLAFRIARRDLPVPVAASIAAGIVLSEPARVLLGWPSGSQHLLAALFALLAVHEAQARRLPTAALAALAGVLSHESAALALPLIPLITWRERHEARAALASLGAVAAVAAVWRAGYAIALRHGVATPPVHSPADLPGQSIASKIPTLLSKAFPAALNLEDVQGPERTFVLCGLALAAVIAGVVFALPAGRPRLRAALPMALAGIAWFVLGVLPLALLLPDWNAWRAWTPAIGLTFAIPALLGTASPWLAGVWVGLRLAALLVAPVVTPLVTRTPPPNGSHVSFPQLVRLQTIVSATREVLAADVPKLAPHDRVCYWEMPRLAEFAYQGSKALQVWYGDSTLSWTPFGGQKGLTTPLAAGVEFRFADTPFAASIPRRAIVLYQQAAALSIAGHEDRADSVLRESMAVVGHDRGPFIGTLYENMALNAYRRQRYEQADTLNELALRVGAETGSYWLMRAARAIQRGDNAMARAAIRRSLQLDAGNEAARQVARQLGVLP
jgi:hypothetical protein